MVQETLLKDNDETINFNGYKCLRRDRRIPVKKNAPVRGGGLAIFYKNSLSVTSQLLHNTAKTALKSRAFCVKFKTNCKGIQRVQTTGKPINL